MDMPLVSNSQIDETPAGEGLAFDELVERALQLCEKLPDTAPYGQYRRQIAELSERLAGGRLHFAVLGQFNRGKSTFLNALLGVPVLPVSVLPITSVPTIIVQGSRTTCTVEFDDGREPVRAADSVDDITQVLVQYVAEQNNPRNERGVGRVTVTADCPVLRHGTVLIDTPGFGSTHVHNTKTTRALIEGCDAALFLLSADLPITQVEVDFLRDVKRFVPRIFFVYNKTDILSHEELETTTQYVRDVLIRTLQFTGDLYLFPICAKAGQDARQHDPGDSAWSRSGMEKIKSEVIDFMLREKYFALSQALGEKYKGALDGILGLLREDRAALAAPLEKLKSDAQKAQSYIESLQREIHVELGFVPREERALCQQFDQRVAAGREELHKNITQSVESLLNAAAARPGSHELVHSSIAALFDEMFGRLYLQLASAVNTPLRERAAAYGSKLEQCAARITADLGCETDLLTVERPNPPQIETSVAWRPAVRLDMPVHTLSQIFMERLRGRSGRQRIYARTVLPLVHEHADLCLQELSNTIRNRIRAALGLLAESLSRQYAGITVRLEHWQAEKQRRLHDTSGAAVPQIERLDALSTGFAAARESLV